MNYWVMQTTADGQRRIMFYGMDLREAERTVESLKKGGEELGYATKFCVVAADPYPACAKCGAVCPCAVSKS